MKRLFASALAVLFCLSLCVAILYADPGDTTQTDSGYPPPPPEVQGFWPPPDGIYTTTGDSNPYPTDTLGNGSDPWKDPDQ